jgi:hypothetical protein
MPEQTGVRTLSSPGRSALLGHPSSRMYDVAASASRNSPVGRPRVAPPPRIRGETEARAAGLVEASALEERRGGA